MIKSRQILAFVPLAHEHRHAYDPPGVGAPDEDAGYEVLDHAHQVAVPQQHVHLQLELQTMLHEVFTIMKEAPTRALFWLTLVEALSVIVKLQCSRRFVSSSPRTPTLASL